MKHKEDNGSLYQMESGIGALISAWPLGVLLGYLLKPEVYSALTNAELGVLGLACIVGPAMIYDGCRKWMQS
jgi:hypothetical protein